MNRAIRCLTDRTEKINEEIAKLEKSMQEPEMSCDILFAENTIDNLIGERSELQRAIIVLLKQK